jgi:hypothetical protein
LVEVVDPVTTDQKENDHLQHQTQRPAAHLTALPSLRARRRSFWSAVGSKQMENHKARKIGGKQAILPVTIGIVTAQTMIIGLIPLSSLVTGLESRSRSKRNWKRSTNE